MRIPAAVLAVLALASAARSQGNVLLIIADDLGVDRIAAYGEHPDPGHTPNIDALAARGVLFRNAWSDPVCSSTRSTILLGRYGFRTGTGRAIGPVDDREVSIDETSIADVLSPLYATAAVGKWHMQSDPGSGPLLHPLNMGFDHYAGGMDVFPGFIGNGYDVFLKNIDGTLYVSTTYATTDEASDALFLTNWLPEPWFIWLAFHAPHAPFHAPPASLHSFNLPGSVSSDIPLHVKAMVEAMDTEIGNLFARMDPGILADTTVIFVGDNGTDKLATTPPFDPDRAKRTIYEGGINVPLIVAGPGVALGAECAALVDTADIFATVAEIAGVAQSTGTDSVSMVPYLSNPAQPSMRQHGYAEFFEPNGWSLYTRNDRAVRDERHKLLRFHQPESTVYREELYDLLLDPFEQTDLLLGALTPEQQTALDSLRAALSDRYVPWVDAGAGLAGTHGVPTLAGSGSLAPATPVSVTLGNALPNSWAVLFLGLDTLSAPFYGGTMVPDFTPTNSLFLVNTDVTGGVQLATTWPAGLPPGMSVYLQVWQVDPLAAYGVSGSNALRGMTPP